MGWSFNTVDYGRKAFIESLTGSRHFAEGYTPIAHRVVGNHVWQAVRVEATGHVFIHLDLIAKERGAGWGYKGMSEYAHPYHYDCPLSLLDLCTDTVSENALAWRQKVREHHAKRKAAPAPKAGMVVNVAGQDYTLVAPHGPRSGWIVTMVGGSGFKYRLGAAALKRALVELG